MIIEEQVWERLKTVMDPELNVSIVDLGLIYKVRVQNEKGGAKINILMTLTTPGCPLAGMFDALVKNALKDLPGLDGEEDVKVELTFDPPWGTHLMSREAKAELGFD